MRLGAHVRTSGGLVNAVERGEATGAEVVQVFPQNSRAWKSRRLDPVLFAEYRTTKAASDVVTATYCHAIYLINLASHGAGAADLAVARRLHAEGLGLYR